MMIHVNISHILNITCAHEFVCRLCEVTCVCVQFSMSASEIKSAHERQVQISSNLENAQVA